ncbi:MAG: hypothetical protein ACI9N1_000192 [Flavobacteriales bacterium]|jgi:hypothetical protein
MDDAPKETLFTAFSKRSTFLKVLFILSANYIVFNLFGAIYNSIASDMAIENIENTISQIQYSEMSQVALADPYRGYLNHYLVNFSLNNLLSMIVLLIDALGIIIMFKGRKIGYWIYTLSNVILVIGTITLSVWPNIFSSIFLMLTIVFFGAFQVLYAVNLKHLKA